MAAINTVVLANFFKMLYLGCYESKVTLELSLDIARSQNRVGATGLYVKRRRRSCH